MRNWHLPILALTVAVLIAAGPLFAHHANSVFDTKSKVTVKGAVVEWFWANPHCLLRFDVKDENGEVAHWVGETQAPINIIGNGWRKDSFKPGDEITVTLQQLKNGKPGGSIQSVVLASGKVLNARFAGVTYPPDPSKPEAPKSEEEPKGK